jgi:hypothetical protein
MICYVCLKEKGGVGRGINLQRQGVVKGSGGMANYVSICTACLFEQTRNKTAVKSRYEEANKGT